MKKIFIIFGAISLLAAGCNNSGQTAQEPTSPTNLTANQQFNPDLVAAKQKCQSDFEKYKADNTINNSSGTDMFIRAHFNANLNTCLVDYLYNESNGTQQNEVIDIYDSNKKLLELDLFTQSEPGIPVGQYLYANGQAVKISGPSKEYDKRRAALFEEPAPNY